MLRILLVLSCVISMVMIIISCGSDPTSPETGVMDVSGAWQGTWESTNYQTSGPFSAVFTQNGSELTGFIDIPYIGFDDVQITGSVNSNNVAFGDVGDEIQFIGTISSDTASASGSYTNPGLSDEGTWIIERLSGSGITLVDSIQVPSMMFGSDITWAASKFWILASPYIYSVDPSTGVLDSIVAPGYYLCGLTYDGTSLIVAEDDWGDGRIFKLDPMTNSVLMSPDGGVTGGLAYDGSSFWCLDEYAPCIYRMNGEGTVLGSFSCLGDFASGLAFDGTDLWYSSFSGSSSSIIYQVDTDGNLISSFEAPSFIPGGLTFDGQSLWYSDNDDDVVYELDMDGTVLSSFDSPSDGNDLAWDGTHLWLACGYPSSSCQIYCMDRSGSVVASIECPGDQPRGLTYDGTDLWNADVNKKLIFRLDTDGGNINQLPPFEFDYLAFDGTLFWANDIYQSLICSFDEDGTVAASFSYPCDEIGGLEWMNGSMWVFGEEQYALSSAYRMDADGTILDQYVPTLLLPEPAGLTDDGSSLWYLGSRPLGTFNMLYKTAMNQ